MGQIRAKKKSRKTAARSAPNKVAMAAGFFVSGIAVTLLAFISLEIAVSALGFMALGSYIYFEGHKRRLWEQSISFKFRTVDDKQEKLTQELERSRFDIRTIREDMEDLEKKAPTKKYDALLSDDPPAAGRMSLDYDPIPKAMSPGRAARKPLTNPEPENLYTGSENISDTAVKELVHSAVRNKRVDVFVQPVVRLPQRKARFYEVFAHIRAKPGLYLPATRYMELARQEAVMNEIDHLLLMQCLKTIRDTAHIEHAAPFFINITPATLANGLFMRQLLGFLSQNRHLAPWLIFEIRQKDFDDMSPAILEILRGLGRIGCALSLDHVKNMDFDLKFLQVLKVRFVKINARDLLQKTKSDKAFTDMERLKRRIEGNGIGFIVEKIENEYMLKELLDLDIHYGQGYLFGRPDLQAAYKRKQSA